MCGLLVKVREAAKVLGTSPMTVLDLVDTNRLRAETIRGQVFVLSSSLTEYVKNVTEGRVDA